MLAKAFSEPDLLANSRQIVTPNPSSQSLYSLQEEPLNPLDPRDPREPKSRQPVVADTLRERNRQSRNLFFAKCLHCAHIFPHLRGDALLRFCSPECKLMYLVTIKIPTNQNKVETR